MSNAAPKSLIRTLLEQHMMNEIESISLPKPAKTRYLRDWHPTSNLSMTIVAKKNGWVVAEDENKDRFFFFYKPKLEMQYIITKENEPMGVIALGYKDSPEVPNDIKQYPDVDWIQIKKEMQGKGLAEFMYDFVIDHYGGLWSGYAQSPGSRNAWAKLALNKRYYVLAYNNDNQTFHNVGVQAQEGSKGKKPREEVFPWSEQFPLYSDSRGRQVQKTPSKDWKEDLKKKTQEEKKKTQEDKQRLKVLQKLQVQKALAIKPFVTPEVIQWVKLRSANDPIETMSWTDIEKVDEFVRWIERYYHTPFQKEFPELLKAMDDYQETADKVWNLAYDLRSKLNNNNQLESIMNHRMFACKKLPPGVAKRVES